MATESFAGPVDYVVFRFDDGADIGPGLAALLEAVDQSIIEILDLAVVSLTAEAAVTRLALADLNATSSVDLSIFDGAASHILDDDDLTKISGELTPGRFALAVVYEDRSLATAAAAWATVGGTELFSGGIDLADLEATLEGNQS